MDDPRVCPTPLDPFRRGGATRRRMLGLIAALSAALLPGGCKGFGQNKDSTASDPPRRKPNAITASGQSPAGGPVRLDGSAANDSGAAPNAPGIQGAVLAGPATTGGAPGLAQGALGVGTGARGGSSAQSPPEEEDDEGPVLPTSGFAVDPRDTEVVQAEDLRPAEEEIGPDERDSWTLDAGQEATGTIKRRIEFEDNGTKVIEGEVAAMVNGVPILSDDIIRTTHAEKHLAQNQKLMPPDVFREFRRRFIEKYLDHQIDQELLLHELKKKHKEEQIASMYKQIEHVFEKEFLPGEIKNAKVNTRGELDLLLQQQGSSIEALRANFRNRELARHVLGSKTQVREGFDRPDVLKYYKEHLDEFTVPGKVKWDQIQIRFSKRSDRAAAQKKAEDIMARLKSGEEFGKVARECSNGANASKGGRWGWTTQGSLADKEIDEALFQREVGEIGPPIEAAKSISIIRVVDRQDSRVQTFEEVQEDIKIRLKDSLQQKRISEYQSELRKNATIVKFTDRM